MTKTINTHLPNNIHICSSAELASQKVAQQIAHEILAKQKLGQHIVLGFATGNTPKLVYHELVRMHQNEGLSFKNVISFNLDEYYPMNPEHPLSYDNFMQLIYLIRWIFFREIFTFRTEVGKNKN